MGNCVLITVIQYPGSKEPSQKIYEFDLKWCTLTLFFGFPCGNIFIKVHNRRDFKHSVMKLVNSN